MVQQANKKVVGALQSNKITIKDVRVRTRFWNKPFEDEKDYLDLICYTGWEPWKENYKFIPFPSVWEEIVGGKARRGVVKQLDDFAKGYRAVVDILPLRPKQDIGKNYDIFSVKYDREREKELTARAMAGEAYEQQHGRGGIDIPIKDIKGNVVETYKCNQYARFFFMDYFVVANANNTLTINTVNAKQLDFLKPNIVFFFRGNKYSDKAKTNREARRLYWCRSVSYINDKKNTCQIVLESCDFWSYWGDACNSRGKANIFTSQLGMTHGTGEAGHEEGKHYADDPAGNYQNENYCRACDMCFDFCGDLRLKRAVGMGYRKPEPKPAKFQPSWKLLCVFSGDNASRGANAITLTNEDGSSAVVVPSSIYPVKWSGAGSPWGNNPVLYYMVDSEHNPETSPTSKAIHKPNKGEDFWEDLPACYAEQPHLLNHSTLQCFFQKKLLFTANYKHLKIRKFSGGSGATGIAKDGLKFCLGYHIIIRSSVAGILYNFESADIFFKWEVKVSGSEQSMGLFDRLFGLIDKFMSAIGGGDPQSELQSIQASSGWMSAIPNLLRMIRLAAREWLKKQIAPDFNQMVDAEKYKAKTGLKEDKAKSETDKAQAQAEEQTKRQKASTAKAVYRAVEPSIFYSNTISMTYSFFEFANRAINNPVMFRNEHSNLHYDNLINNNNKNPIQTFNCKFSQLKQTLAEGDWAGEVELFDFPYKGFFERILAGTTLYKNPNKYFTPWKPKFKTLQSFTYSDTSNAGVAQGQEQAEIDEKTIKEKFTEELISADMSNADYGNADYIGSGTPALWSELNAFNSNCHPGSSPVPNNCLGCLCGGGSHGKPDYSFERVYNFTVGGEIRLKTRGSGEQICQVPEGGGKVVFWAKGNSGGLTLESETSRTERNYKYNFVFDKIEAEKEAEILGIDYKEPTFEPNETEADVDIEWDNDQDKDDFDMEEDIEKNEANEQEQDDDWDNDIDKDRDLDNDDDNDQDQELDNDIDVDLDRDQDKDKDKDNDDDVDNDKDNDDKDNEQDIDNTDLDNDIDVDTGGG